MPDTKPNAISRAPAFGFDAKTRIRLYSLAGGMADCGINVLILFVFAFNETIPFDVPQKVLFIGVVLNTIFFLCIASGRSQSCADPAFTGAQILAGCGANLVALLMAPQICYMFLFNLFVYLSFGSLHFNKRQFITVWIVLSFALAGVLSVVGPDLRIAYARQSERTLFWLILTTALGRAVLINMAISRLRSRLHDKNRQLAAASEQLKDLAAHDDLTRLWNRRKFMARLEEEAGRAGRTGMGFSVAVLDVDFFKHINDRLGHLAGDAVLRELALVLRMSGRTTDVLARYGGEEFTILFLDTSSEMAAVGLERLCRIVEQHGWTTIAPELTVTISAGLASWHPNETSEQVLGRADHAMYLAKHSGRNCVRVADSPPELTGQPIAR